MMSKQSSNQGGDGLFRSRLWGRALWSLAFAPAGMRQIIRLYAAVSVLGIMATTGVVLAAQPWPEPEAPVCRAGVVTAHNLIPAVLANYPERRDAAADGYFAPVMCQELGKVFTLKVKGETLTVRAVDCAAWSVGKWPQKGGAAWLGDLGREAWPEGAPLAPLAVVLCERGEQSSNPEHPMSLETPHVE